MIEKFYTDITINRLSKSDEFGGNSGTSYGLDETIKGYTQLLSSTDSNRFSSDNEKAVKRLYTNIDTTLLRGDKVDVKYLVINAEGQENGISNTGHHKEYIIGHEV